MIKDTFTNFTMTTQNLILKIHLTCVCMYVIYVSFCENDMNFQQKSELSSLGIASLCLLVVYK